MPWIIRLVATKRPSVPAFSLRSPLLSGRSSKISTFACIDVSLWARVHASVCVPLWTAVRPNASEAVGADCSDREAYSQQFAVFLHAFMRWGWVQKSQDHNPVPWKSLFL